LNVIQAHAKIWKSPRLTLLGKGFYCVDDKGMSRQIAYKIVQRSAMKQWESSNKSSSICSSGPEVMAVLSVTELEALFDYNYYLRFVDDVFERLGLTGKQWIE